MVAAAAPRRLGQGAWISLDGSQRPESAVWHFMPALERHLRSIRKEYPPPHCLCCLKLPAGAVVRPLPGRWITVKKAASWHQKSSSSAPAALFGWLQRPPAQPMDLDIDDSLELPMLASPGPSPTPAQPQAADAPSAELAAPRSAELAVPRSAELAVPRSAELAVPRSSGGGGEAASTAAAAAAANADAAALEDISAMARAAVAEPEEEEDSWMALLEAAEEPPQESLVQDLYPPAAPPRSAELAPAPSAELAPGYNFHALSRTALPRTDGPQSWLSRHGGEESLPAAAAGSQGDATFSDFPDF